MSPNARPRLVLLHGDGRTPHPSQIRRDHSTMPVSIMLHGDRTVGLLCTAVKERHDPGESAADVILRALETVFEDIKLGASEDQPPTVVAEALQYGDGHWEASIQVFAAPEPPPPPRCG